MKVLVFIFSVIFLISCKQQQQKEFIVIDMDKNTSEKSISFDEIADNFKWIALESRDDILLENYIQYWINSKYIIAIGQNSIHQFNIEGKHIRKLANAGKGPREYQYVSCYVVDDEKDIFYFTHGNDKDNINCIDLKTGEYKDKINITLWGNPINMTIYNNNLLCFGNQISNKDTAYIAYLITPLGELKESITEVQKEENKNSFSLSFAPSISYIKGKNENIQYCKDDTIYNLKFPYPEPLFGIIYKDKFNIDNNPEGINHSFYFQTADWYILRKTDIHYQIGDNNVNRVSMRSQDNYLIDKESYELFKLKNIFISSLDSGYSPFSFSVSNNCISMSINAFEFKETLEKLLETEKEVAEELENLASKITEDDNPVLLIGKLK